MLEAYKELTSSRSKMPPIASDRGFFVFDFKRPREEESNCHAAAFLAGLR